jgi:hypothetical protein
MDNKTLTDLQIFGRAGRRNLFGLPDFTLTGGDALRCSERVIEKLLLWKDSFFLLSTHIAELAARFSVRLRCHYLDAALKQGEPCFTYDIKEGISTEQFGLVLLERSGVGQLLTPVKQPASRR